MKQKENTRPVVAATERASGEFADSISLYEKSIMLGAGSQGRVTACLGVGAANAIAGRDLVRLLGLRSLRTLTRLIERERRMGSPICAAVSGSRGYYLAADPLELERYVKSLDRRLRAVGETRRRMGDVLARLTGQEQIRGWEA